METYKFGNFEISLSAKFTNEYIDKFGNGEMGKFLVYAEYNGKRLQFGFYESVYDTKAGKKNLTGKDLVDAFRCFISDVLLILSNNWEKSEIEKEIGEISSQTYIELKRSANSFLRLFNENDIYDLWDSINEYMEKEE